MPALNGSSTAVNLSQSAPESCEVTLEVSRASRFLRSTRESRSDEQSCASPVEGRGRISRLDFHAADRRKQIAGDPSGGSAEAQVPRDQVDDRLLFGSGARYLRRMG
jgi:hypothetical protein